MKIDVKMNSVLIKNLLYGGKNELEINSILTNEPYIFAMKNELEINLTLMNEPCIRVGKSMSK